MNIETVASTDIYYPMIIYLSIYLSLSKAYRSPYIFYITTSTSFEVNKFVHNENKYKQEIPGAPATIPCLPLRYESM